MIKIALTGGIGTGKTYISQQFAAIGIPIYYADDEAKKLYQDAEVVNFLHKQFGEVIFKDGTLCLPKLAEQIFTNPQQLTLLNNFLHPLVMAKFNAWAEEQKSSMVIMESAIIFEANLTHHFDKIWVVNAPLDIRIERIKKRNPHLTLDNIRARIANQISQEEKCKHADLVIDNTF